MHSLIGHRPEYSWKIARLTLNTNQSINQLIGQFKLLEGLGLFQLFRTKPPTCRKSLTSFITSCCIEYTSPERKLLECSQESLTEIIKKKCFCNWTLCFDVIDISLFFVFFLMLFLSRTEDNKYIYDWPVTTVRQLET